MQFASEKCISYLNNAELIYEDYKKIFQLFKSEDESESSLINEKPDILK